MSDTIRKGASIGWRWTIARATPAPDLTLNGTTATFTVVSRTGVTLLSYSVGDGVTIEDATTVSASIPGTTTDDFAAGRVTAKLTVTEASGWASIDSFPLLVLP